MFIDPTNYNFGLTPQSPCLSSGRYGDDRGALPMISWIDNELLPESYIVAGNYPNPFNASTKIRYYLMEDADITIEVYNLIGQKIETLFTGYRQAGEHSILWDASNAVSGVYFYRISSEDYNIAKRCTLLK